MSVEDPSFRSPTVSDRQGPVSRCQRIPGKAFIEDIVVEKCDFPNMEDYGNIAPSPFYSKTDQTFASKITSCCVEDSQPSG